MDSFEQLYAQYADGVYHYLLGITGEKALAEELTQETFVRALQNIGKFRGESSLLTWLCSIGKRLFTDEQRRKRKQTLPPAAGYMAPGALPEQLLQDKAAMLQVHKVLHDLPNPGREVFSLRIFGELKFKEIAEIFGKSESWAKVTFFRVKDRIIEEMEAQGWL